jgi:nicotinate-nucleotide pyrophosphorylase (carboxylating)
MNSFYTDLEAGGLDPAAVTSLIRATLAEDLAYGPDVTTIATIPAQQTGRASIVAREAGTLAGVPIAALVPLILAEETGVRVTVDVHLKDSSRVERGDDIITIEGPIRTLLTAERTMLNLISQLSGVATHTATWVAALEGSHAKVRDTRKTVPGLRELQKYAVRCGGGVNHRMGLGDAALIKDNHVAAAGSITAAVNAVRSFDPSIPLEVECDTVDQVREAIDAGTSLILLDNMSPDTIRDALTYTQPAGVSTEASGGITLGSAQEYAATGVDYIAVGALTHSSKVLDLGFDLH